MCFLCFIGLWKKREHSGSLEEEEDQERAEVCEGDRMQDTCDRAHQRLSPQEEDRMHLGSHAKEGD